jgi:hypothetical protein
MPALAQASTAATLEGRKVLDEGIGLESGQHQAFRIREGSRKDPLRTPLPRSRPPPLSKEGAP